MSVHIVRFGSPRAKGEGIRLGTVRRPPRGVPKGEIAGRDFYDVWLPNLAPSAPLVKAALGAQDEREWASFERRYRAEMAKPDPSRVLDALAALARGSDFAVGCYCADERRCHRSVLRALFAERGAPVR